MTTTTWTDREIAALRLYYREGYTFTQIARALRKTRNAISGKANRLGLIGRRPEYAHHVPRRRSVLN